MMLLIDPNLANGYENTYRKKTWAIAEGYIPSWSNGPEPQFTSHETACMLNMSDADAHVEIIIYFSDREPAGPYKIQETFKCINTIQLPES